MSISKINQSLIGLTDSYKVSHHLQYPKKLEYLYSYFESRGGEFDETVFYGLRYIIDEYLSKPITAEDIDFFEEQFAQHFLGDGSVFNREGWEYILKYYDGYLPVRIRAVPEGSVIPNGNVLMTVENTDPKVPWVTNYLETLLCQVWYPSTVATLSREAKKIIAKYGDLTGMSRDELPFKLHDFGFRGAASVEQAAIGGSAHLVNFQGTDTMPGYLFANAYYDAQGMTGFSIPAAEHSTIMTWEREVDAFDNMIKQFGYGGGGIFAVVSDTYDLWNACEHLWGGELKHKVEAMPNMLVVRPDSGEVVPTVMQTLSILGEKFGTTVNEAGYAVLNNVRVIQGDGMTLDMIEAVCEEMAARRWSISNIAFGMGGGLLQRVHRDTSRYAFKASAATIDGYEREIRKAPATDMRKASKPGRLSLIRTEEGGFETTSWYDTAEEADLLKVVYDSGQWFVQETFEDIRARAEIAPTPTPELV